MLTSPYWFHIQNVSTNIDFIRFSFLLFSSNILLRVSSFTRLYATKLAAVNSVVVCVCERYVYLSRSCAQALLECSCSAPRAYVIFAIVIYALRSVRANFRHKMKAKVDRQLFALRSFCVIFCAAQTRPSDKRKFAKASSSYSIIPRVVAAPKSRPPAQP